MTAPPGGRAIARPAPARAPGQSIFRQSGGRFGARNRSKNNEL